MRWFVLLMVTTAAAAAAQVTPQVSMRVDVGFGGLYRQGAWTPVYVTVTDSRTESAVLQITSPHGSISAMHISQDITIGPAPTMYEVFVPLYQSMGSTHVSISAGNHELAWKEIADYGSAVNGAFPVPPADNGDVVVALSGRGSSAAILQSDLNMPACKSGWVAQSHLPFSAIGYDGVDALILDSPTWSQIDPDSEKAIVDWVRAGGNLILWPGQGAAPPPGDVLAAVLPAQIGLPRTFSVSAADRDVLGLGERFASLTGHDLQPRAGAAAMRFFGENSGSDAAVGYRQRVGLGNILILPVDLGLAQFIDGQKRAAFWSLLIEDVVPDAAQRLSSPNGGYGGNMDQAYSSAVTNAAQLTGDVPGLGRFDFSYIAICLIGLMIVVGPVDWFVLRKLGMQPWTWVTTAGWIVLVTTAAIEAGYWLKSGDLYFNTVRVVDEVNDGDAVQVASRGVVAIYSPQSARYDIEPAAGGWWEPLLGQTYMGGQQSIENMDFVQHRDSTVPDNVLVRIWDIRFLRDEAIQSQPAMIRSHLALDADNRLRGTIANLGTTRLQDVTVRGAGTVSWSIGDVPPGTMNVNASAKMAGGTSGGRGSTPFQAYAGMYGPVQKSESFDVIGDLADYRTKQIEAAMQKDHRVCVYARVENPSPLATQQKPGAKMQNWEIIRSLVTLEPDAAATTAP